MYTNGFKECVLLYDWFGNYLTHFLSVFLFSLNHVVLRTWQGWGNWRWNNVMTTVTVWLVADSSMWSGKMRIFSWKEWMNFPEGRSIFIISTPGITHQLINIPRTGLGLCERFKWVKILNHWKTTQVVEDLLITLSRIRGVPTVS